MEDDIKRDIGEKIKELLAIDPQEAVVDYIYTAAIKNNTSKEKITTDFSAMLNEVSAHPQTRQYVWPLFLVKLAKNCIDLHIQINSTFCV